MMTAIQLRMIASTANGNASKTTSIYVWMANGQSKPVANRAKSVMTQVLAVTLKPAVPAANVVKTMPSSAATQAFGLSRPSVPTTTSAIQ